MRMIPSSFFIFAFRSSFFEAGGICIREKTWWCLTSTETIRFIREGGWGVGVIIYLSVHCHHQNDLCIKVGIDENYFNVS